MRRFFDAITGRWRDLLDGFWFVPGLIALGGPLLALFFVWLDHRLSTPHLLLLFSGNATAASGILSAIAASFIAALGLSFSITMVILQLVTSQFTPRALRGFLADRITQTVSGGFIGIFAYALLVLTAVHDPSQTSAGFVPTISVTVAIVLSFLGLVLLLLFFHHTAESIQIYNITARLARETLRAIQQLYPSWANGSPTEDGTLLVQHWKAEASAYHLRAMRSGYVQSIAFHHLLWACTRLGPGLRIHLLVCPGDFVTAESIIAEIWSQHELDKRAIAAFGESVNVLNQRDMLQDAAFGIRQLTDIALRAMSPAVNDPTTAVNCIQYLQVIFEQLALKSLPAVMSHHVSEGSSLLVMRARTFDEYLQAFVEIGRVTTQNARVADALLATLEVVMYIASRESPERLPVLDSIAEAIATPALEDARTRLDRVQLENRLKRIGQLTALPHEQDSVQAQTPA